MKGIGIKWQTPRATNYISDRVNVAIDCGKFCFALCTSKYWGDFKDYPEDPLVEIETGKTSKTMRLSQFQRLIDDLI